MSDGAATSGSEDRASADNPLKAARKARNMTRAQVVDAANAHIRARDGANSAEVLTVGLLGKLERGEHKTPRGTLKREALQHALGVGTGAELGWPLLRSQAQTASRGQTGVGDRDHAGAVPGQGSDLDTMLDETTSAVARAASITEGRTVSPTAMRTFRSRLASLSTEFVHRPAEQVAPKLCRLWADVSVHLQHGPRRHQGSELYLVAGMVCLVLAHLSHVRGLPHQGLVHTEAAQLWAHESGHEVLLGWALGTEALLTNSIKGPVPALQLIDHAQDVLRRSSRPGSSAVRLACYEARFSCEAGQHDRGLKAIRASEDAAEALRAGGASDLDVIGGILTFGEPKRVSLCAEPYLGFGRAKLAEEHAQAAINGYLAGPAEQRSYGDVALSRVTLAQARLSAGNLDGVLDAVHPVLALPPQQRIAPIREQLGRLASALNTQRYLDAAEATGIRDSITEFQRPAQAILPM